MLLRSRRVLRDASPVPTKNQQKPARRRKRCSPAKVKTEPPTFDASKYEVGQCFGDSGLRLGSSGYSYRFWKDIFYPSSIRSADYLSFYSSEFDAVELNASFYRVAPEATWKGWNAKSPRPSFLFVVKANQYFTHMKRLKVDEDFVSRWEVFWSRCLLLGKHLGPVLFQLPPGVASSTEKLHNLAKVLPGGHRFVFEFRHPSWYCQEVYDILRQNNWCLAQIHVKTSSSRRWCGLLSSGWHPSMEYYDSLCDWGEYVRLHGFSGQYVGRYPPEQLDLLLQRLLQRQKTRANYVGFIMCNNTDDGSPPSAIADLRCLAYMYRHQTIK